MVEHIERLIEKKANTVELLALCKQTDIRFGDFSADLMKEHRLSGGVL